MKINNLNVNTEAIANGMYEIICDAGEESLVAFGMIPNWIVELATKQIREKILREAAAQVMCTPEEIAPIVDMVKVDEMTRQIVHEISVGIYAAAKRAGKMVV